jgi:hypothetical protein
MANFTYDQMSRMNTLCKSGSSCNIIKKNAFAKYNTSEKHNWKPIKNQARWKLSCMFSWIEQQ